MRKSGRENYRKSAQLNVHTVCMLIGELNRMGVV